MINNPLIIAMICLAMLLTPIGIAVFVANLLRQGARSQALAALEAQRHDLQEWERELADRELK